MLSIFLSIVSLLATAIASPLQSRAGYAVKETHFVPRGWSEVGKPRGEMMITLSVGLKQSNFEELERHLYEVSDPDHERYGNHLSHDEVSSLVKPTEKTSKAVHEWLKENGVEELTYSSSKDWISFSISIASAERLLDTEYSVFEHEDGDQLVRTPKWSLPSHLHEHIDAIQPTTSFMRISTRKTEFIHLEPWVSPSYKKPTNTAISKVCNVTSVTPDCFKTLYGTKGYEVQSNDTNKVAFNNFLGEFPVRPDTYTFLKKYNPGSEGSAYTFKTFSIDNGPLQDGPLTLNQSLDSTSMEANVDVQAIAGMSYPTPLYSYSTGGSPPFNPSINTDTNTNEPYLVWLNYILNQTSIPQVISTSYGDDEQTVPYAYALRVCQSFAQLGARGVSVLFASGDSGVGGNKTCISNDGTNRTMFLPEFPSSCPYITSVGSTHEFEPEVVAYWPGRTDKNGRWHELYSSGGGFSNYFPTPSYQEKTVKGYVAGLNGSFKGLYNSTGRAYPDIAAQGQYFAYVWNGTEGTISGTSASTPLMAGILALVNDELLSCGKQVLGFLNPWLYKRGFKAFTDIKSGSAKGCGTDGFDAREGWDPVSGWGTPRFGDVVAAAKGF